MAEERPKYQLQLNLDPQPVERVKERVDPDGNDSQVKEAKSGEDKLKQAFSFPNSDLVADTKPIDPYAEIDFENAHDLTQQRQRYKRKPKKPANVIAQLMARKGYSQQTSANEIETIWSEVAGTNWSKQTRVSIIRGGTLEIMVENSVLIQRLEFEKKQLLTQLQKRLPKSSR